MQRQELHLENLSVENHWFDRPSLRTELPPISERAVVVRSPIGHSGWSIVLGALAGALGGLSMLAVTEQVLHHQHSALDLASMLGSKGALAKLWLTSDRQAGFAVAAALGAAAGAPLGFLARRLLRIAPRLLFFILFAPILWTFVQACVMTRLAPWLAANLPFIPLAAGALVYGVCIALVPPIRAR
jgi:hypothetical protein